MLGYRRLDVTLIYNRLKSCAHFEEEPILSETNLMADALQLIAENKRTGFPFLDLGNCGLTKVPAEVSELVWLKSLSFGGRYYNSHAEQWLPRHGQNSGARNDRLMDLGPLAGLSALQMLDVSEIQVSDLAPLARLSALRTLNVSGTQVSDLAPLAGLSALQTLFVYDTQVSDLAPLAGLSALRTLDVSKTQVTDLAPLASLSALQRLRARSNRKLTATSVLAIAMAGKSG